MSKEGGSFIQGVGDVVANVASFLKILNPNNPARAARKAARHTLQLAGDHVGSPEIRSTVKEKVTQRNDWVQKEADKRNSSN